MNVDVQAETHVLVWDHLTSMLQQDYTQDQGTSWLKSSVSDPFHFDTDPDRICFREAEMKRIQTR